MSDFRNLGYESFSIREYMTFWASSKDVRVGALIFLAVDSLVRKSILI
jgi:hypothetical protein